MFNKYICYGGNYLKTKRNDRINCKKYHNKETTDFLSNFLVFYFVLFSSLICGKIRSINRN